MPERTGAKNIFGGVDCRMPGGKILCSACCVALEVPELGKSAGARCPKFSPQNFCRIHPGSNLTVADKRVERCRVFHCSTPDLTPVQKLSIMEAAIKLGQISVDAGNALAKKEYGIPGQFDYLRRR